MTCRDALDFMADYLDGKLPLGQRLSFGLHLCLCRNCRNYLDSYRKTIRASRLALPDPTDDANAEIPEELIQAIIASRPREPRVD